MPDLRFYRRAGPFTVEELARLCGGVVAGGAASGKSLQDIGVVDSATPDEIIYVSESGYLDKFAVSQCGACITTEAFVAKAPKGCAVLVADDPRHAFAQVASAFYPPDQETISDNSELIAPDAVLGAGVRVAPGVVIGAKAEIGANVRIGANSVIGAAVILGDGCKIGENVTVSHAIVGTGVSIAAGSQIGQEGFGFVQTKAGHEKIPQLGRVVIEESVDIGANCAIDRGALGDTVIGAGTKIDNLVQIGHNVEIGRNCIIVSQVGISGSCQIGNGVVIGGQGGLADHVCIGDGAQIAAKSGIMRDIAPGDAVMGYPAKPIRQFWREVAALSRLTKRGK